MHRAILGTMLSGMLLAGVAFADHAERAKADKITFPLVNGYSECDPGSTNATTQSNGSPACAPPASSSFTGCAFTATGHGSLTLRRVGSAKTGDQDLEITAVATGLNMSCFQLAVNLSYRLTTDDCAAGSCTAVDVVDLPMEGAFCNVSNGKCKIKTTLNTAEPGLIATNGKNAGIEILGCGLQERLPLADKSLRCGLLLK